MPTCPLSKNKALVWAERDPHTKGNNNKDRKIKTYGPLLVVGGALTLGHSVCWSFNTTTHTLKPFQGYWPIVFLI